VYHYPRVPGRGIAAARPIDDGRLGAFASYAVRVRKVPTAVIAGGSMIAAYAVVVASGSRPLGGVVLAVGGLWCIRAWAKRRDARSAAMLGCVGFGAFVLSHVLALAIGAWPSVLSMAAVTAAAAWTRVDARTAQPARSAAR